MLASARYWKFGDFGDNPEHPPLAKFIAALPNLGVPCPAPKSYGPFGFKAENFTSAIPYLYTHDAGAMLLRARMAISIFTWLLALLVFQAAREMFGAKVALLALLLFVFEPNLVAHGALVTTDMAVTCFFFAALYTFYRWLRRPSLLRLTLCGSAVGLALASKHSGVFVIPVLAMLALAELPRGRRLLQLAGALAAIAAIGFAVLWACYGFRFHARPAGLAMIPPTAAYLANIPVLPWLASSHLLPEAWLYGLADILHVETRDPSFLLGTMYKTGRWFYFPVAFAIKSTLGFLGLLAAAPFVLRRTARREIVFLLLPALAYLAACLPSKMNLGVRHILPVYPFLIVLVAASAVHLARKHRWGTYAAAALLLFHAAASVRVFPNYLTFANEAFGGPTNTFRLLTDSNADWGQGLKAAKRYLDTHGIHDCWFAHYGWDVNPAYYGIACRPLPSGIDYRFGAPLPPVPPNIAGTVLISASEADGNYWGEPNPYAQFLYRRPDALIANSILVFRGSFDVRLLSSISHAELSP